MAETDPPQLPHDDATIHWRMPPPVPPRAEPPPRSGHPWTDAEYEQILAAVREGVTDIVLIAERIGRGVSPTMTKARRLLPLAERSAPVDRVLRLLREHLDDPDYDWQRTTLEEAPPRPVVQPPALTGVAGLTSEDLTAIGYAVGLAAPVVDEDLVLRVGRELYRRGATHELVAYRAEQLVQRGEIGWDRALAEADTWVARAFAAARQGREGWAPHEYPAPVYW